MLANEPLVLELPRLVLRHDLAASATTDGGHEQTARRVVAAALGMCWTAMRKQGAPRYRGVVLDYGGDVLEMLLTRGVPMADIIAAGNEALTLVLESLATKEQHEEAVGFSGAPVAPSFGSSSGSSAGGTVTPTG